MLLKKQVDAVPMAEIGVNILPVIAVFALKNHGILYNAKYNPTHVLLTMNIYLIGWVIIFRNQIFPFNILMLVFNKIKERKKKNAVRHLDYSFAWKAAKRTV